MGEVSHKVENFAKKLKSLGKDVCFETLKDKSELLNEFALTLSSSEAFEHFIKILSSDEELADIVSKITGKQTPLELATFIFLSMPGALKSKLKGRTHVYQILGPTNTGKTTTLEHVFRGINFLIFNVAMEIRYGNKDFAKKIIKNFVNITPIYKRLGIDIDTDKFAEVMLKGIEKYMNIVLESLMFRRFKGSLGYLSEIFYHGIKDLCFYIIRVPQGRELADRLFEEVLPTLPFITINNLYNYVKDASICRRFVHMFIEDEEIPVNYKFLPFMVIIEDWICQETIANIANIFGISKEFQLRAGLFAFATSGLVMNQITIRTYDEYELRRMYIEDLSTVFILDLVLGAKLLGDKERQSVLNQIINSLGSTDKGRVISAVDEIVQLFDRYFKAVGKDAKWFLDLLKRVITTPDIIQGYMDMLRESSTPVSDFLRHVVKSDEEFTALKRNISILRSIPTNFGQLLSIDKDKVVDNNSKKVNKGLYNFEVFKEILQVTTNAGYKQIELVDSRGTSETVEEIKKETESLQEKIIDNIQKYLEEFENDVRAFNKVLPVGNINEGVKLILKKLSEGTESYDLHNEIRALNFRGLYQTSEHIHIHNLVDSLLTAKEFMDEENFRKFAFRYVTALLGLNPVTLAILKNTGAIVS